MAVAFLYPQPLLPSCHRNLRRRTGPLLMQSDQSRTTAPTTIKTWTWSDTDIPPSSMHSPPRHARFFAPYHDEVPYPASVPFEGADLPPYLDGLSALRVGLARWTAKHADGVEWTAEHDFAALSMLTRLSLAVGHSDAVLLHQRFNCEHYVAALQSRRSDTFRSLSFAATGRSLVRMLLEWRPPLFSRALRPITNYNVITERIPGLGLVARTDTASAQLLDPDTLAVRGEAFFADLSPELRGSMLAPAHGATDARTGEYFSVASDFPLLSGLATYRVFRVTKAAGTKTTPEQRPEVTVLATFQAPTSMLHTVAVTRDYVVFVLPPVRINAPRFVLSNSLGDSLEPTAHTTFVVVPRCPTASQRPRLYHSPTRLSCMHIVNAWQNDADGTDSITLDVCRTLDLDQMIKRLANGGAQTATAPAGSPKTVPFLSPAETPLVRVTIPTTADNLDNAIKVETLVNHGLEMPSMNASWQGKSHRFTYGLAEHDGLTMIRKVDSLERTGRNLAVQNCIVDEPLFVHNPDGTTEDDGALLVMAYDTVECTSSLLVVDARDLQVIATARFGMAVPPSFHWFVDE